MCIWNDNRLLLFLSFFLDMFLITLNFSVRLPTTVLVSSLASPTVNQQSTTTLQTKKQQQQPIYYNQTIKINKRHNQLLSRCVDLIYYCHRRSPLPSIAAVCMCARASNHADDDADTLSLARSHSHPQNRYRPFRWPTKPPRATLWSAAREIRTVTIWSTAGQDHHLYQAKKKTKTNHVKSALLNHMSSLLFTNFVDKSQCSSSVPLVRPLFRYVWFVFTDTDTKKKLLHLLFSRSLYISPAVEAKFDGVWLLSVFWLAYFSFSKCRFSVLRNWFLFVTRLENEAKISWFRCRYRSRQRADFRFTRPTRRII